MTLVEFLRARLDEDERTAQAASGRRWGHDGYGGWHAPFGSSRCTVVRDANPFSHEQDNHVCGSALAPDAEHIARHDPARVLAEVAAKQGIVERWQSMSEESSDPCDSGWAQGLGEALRLLVLPYAEHTDYRQEWKP